MLGRLLHRIDNSGPILFDEFMEMCLYDPEEGFFSAGRVRPGEGADFVTSPEVSPWFGRLIGRWVESVAPPEWPVVEIGGGSGALLASLVAELTDLDPWAVERSQSARELIGAVLPEGNVVDSVGQVDAPHAVVVINEVLDNVPASLVRRTATGWDEVAVDRQKNALILTEVAARAEVAAWADSFLDQLEPGGLGTVQVRAQSLLTEILETFDGVAVCIVDYGGAGADLATLPAGDVVRTYKRQRTGLDLLQSPGETDITVDVNTDALVSIGRNAGADVEVTSQRHFLLAHGAGDQLDRIRTAETEAARSGDVMSQLKARSDAVGLRALLNLSGFGGFRVVTMTREPGTARSASYP